MEAGTQFTAECLACPTPSRHKLEYSHQGLHGEGPIFKATHNDGSSTYHTSDARRYGLEGDKDHKYV